jgi:transposase
MAYATRARFRSGGIGAIRPVQAGRKPYKVTVAMLDRLRMLVEVDPSDLGWARSRWSSELLALQLAQEFGVKIHESYVRRLLPRMHIVYRRPAPYIRRIDPHKETKLARIRELIENLPDDEVVIYEDEVDIHLLPKMGPQWTPKGVQPQVGTPGQNAKRYLAGGINVRTGDVHWLEGTRKNSELFFHFLFLLAVLYPAAKRIHVIVDNYIIHKSKVLQKMMKKTGLTDLIQIEFLPTYSPKYNPVERLWKCLHDTVTRNHRHEKVDQLMVAVHLFLAAAAPFPGAGHATVRTDYVFDVSSV